MVTAMAGLGQWAQHLRAFPTHCLWEAQPDVCTAQLAMGRLRKAADIIFVSVFIALFQFSAKVFPGFQVPWWLRPGEGGRLGRAVGEDVAESIVWRTWKCTRSHMDGKDKVVSSAGDDVFFLPGKMLNVRDDSMQAKKWRKYYRREMEEKILL